MGVDVCEQTGAHLRLTCTPVTVGLADGFALPSKLDGRLHCADVHDVMVIMTMHDAH